VTQEISLNHGEGLRKLREQTVAQRPPELGPDEGARAFQEHKLLAAAIQRVTLLDRHKSESETDAWVRYFVRCFPSPRNGAADARLLFGDWRTSLIKDGAPGARVVMAHGQANAHWIWDTRDRLSIDLESMWDDFERSLGEFEKYLREDPTRRAIALDRFRKKGTFSVEELIPRDFGALAGATVFDSSGAFSASASSSLSVIKPRE
jgi:hypothetical protein